MRSCRFFPLETMTFSGYSVPFAGPRENAAELDVLGVHSEVGVGDHQGKTQS
jgi:hypothetical protein